MFYFELSGHLLIKLFETYMNSKIFKYPLEDSRYNFIEKMPENPFYSIIICARSKSFVGSPCCTMIPTPVIELELNGFGDFLRIQINVRKEDRTFSNRQFFCRAVKEVLGDIGVSGSADRSFFAALPLRIIWPGGAGDDRKPTR